MAVSVEELPYLQARDALLREPPFRPDVHDPPSPQGDFLDRLHPNTPRPTAFELGTTLDLSDMISSNNRIYEFGEEVALRRARGGIEKFWDSSGTIVFPQMLREQFIRDYFVEVGQNDYWDPVDRKNHAGRLLSGMRDDFQALTDDRERLVAAGKLTLYTRHRHPPEEIPMFSIDDLLIFPMQWRDGVDIPYFNAASVLGESGGDKVMVTAQRVASSERLLPSYEVERRSKKWKEHCLAAGRVAQQEWESAFGRLRTTASQEEINAYDAYIDEAEDSVLAAFAETLPLIFFITTEADMGTGHSMPPGEIIRFLRQQHYEALRAA